LPAVSSLRESDLVARLRRRVGTPPAWITIGIGDDAAVVEPPRGALEVLTTDSLIEDVHFRRAWTAARAIGGKAVAVNLSDLAAMGATPRAILLSLALPADLPVDDFDALVDGVVSAAESHGAVLAGGNLARSPGPLVVDVTAIGEVRRRRVLSRSGARAGEYLYLTGSVGGAAAGLALLASGADREALEPTLKECIDRYEQPVPRLRCGRVVAGSRAASGCIDLSDGLASAARQLAEASGTGLLLEAEALPIHPGASTWASRADLDAVQFAVAGGEDYELLFAVPARRERAFLAAFRRCRDLPVTRVGRLRAEPGAWISRAGSLEPLPTGFEHF
jgi:thiamine-monophosphate kinase